MNQINQNQNKKQIKRTSRAIKLKKEEIKILDNTEEKII